MMRKILSLRKLCLRAVVHNMAVLNKISPWRSALRVENLPPELLNDLERMSTQMVDDEDLEVDKSGMTDWYDFLRSLLHHGLLNLSVPKWSEKSLTGLEHLFDALSSRCTGLKAMYVEVPDSNDTGPNKRKSDIRFGRVFFRALPQLSNLQKVHLCSYAIDDWALQQFGKHTTNLVSLQSLIQSSVTSVGFKALLQLCHLREFLFGDMMWEVNEGRRMERKYVRMCARYLPQLRIVGRDFNVMGMTMYENMEKHRNCYHHQVVKKPCELGLEQLALSGKKRPHENCVLPNLKALHLFVPTGDILGLCCRFPNISQLGFYGVKDPTLVVKVLEKVGCQLTRLVLGNVNHDISLPKILRPCPNLVHFSIEGSDIDDFFSLWPADVTLSCLEDVRLVLESEQLPQHMATLLGAPRLKSLEMHDIGLSKDEVDELLVISHEKRILHNEIKISWINLFLKVQPWMAERAHLETLLDSLDATFPNLQLERQYCVFLL